jgi:hypothetical protein
MGCTSTRTIAPREYLDEKTAATITAVADPWIFNREGAPPQLDFVHLYAIDVNRMGDHRKYLVVVKYWPAPELSSADIPTLELGLSRDGLRLEPGGDDPRDLGIGQPIDPSAPRSAKSWFYPIDKAGLAAVSKAQALSLTLVLGDTRAPYVVWRDGSAALSEFATVAQDW